MVLSVSCGMWCNSINSKRLHCSERAIRPTSVHCGQLPSVIEVSLGQCWERAIRPVSVIKGLSMREMLVS